MTPDISLVAPHIQGIDSSVLSITDQGNMFLILYKLYDLIVVDWENFFSLHEKDYQHFFTTKTDDLVGNEMVFSVAIFA